jgi:hypothetical protein
MDLLSADTPVDAAAMLVEFETQDLEAEAEEDGT